MTVASSSLVNRITMSEVATHDATAPVAGATWIHLPADGAPRIDKTQDRDAVIRTNMRGNSTLSRPTRKSASLSLDLPLFTGTLGFDGTGGDADPTSCYLQKLFESAVGGVANNDGAGAQANFSGTTLTGGSTSVPEFTAVTNLRVGDFVAFDTTFQVRQVMKIETLAVTVDRPISSAGIGVAVYGCHNYRVYLDANAGASTKHLWVNQERDNSREEMAGPGRFMISFDNMSAGAGLRLKAQFVGATWTAGVTPSSFTDLTTTFTGAELVGIGATLSIGGTEVQANIKSLSLGIIHSWHQATTGLYGSDGLHVVGQLDPQLSVSRLYASDDWTQFASRGGAHVMGSVSVGSTAAAKNRGTFAFALPNAERDVKEGIEEQMDINDLTFIGKDPTATQQTNGMTNCMHFGFFGGI